MNDHDLLIQINTQLQTINDKTDDIQAHVAVMNSEQGNQANKIVKIETEMSLLIWILGAVTVAVIGQVIEMLFRYRNKKNENC